MATVNNRDMSHPIVLVSIPSEERSRSVSPHSPTSSDLKGIRLFRAITRKLSRRRTRDDYDSADSSSSSSSSEGQSDSPDSSDSAFRRVINSLSNLSAERRPSDSNSDTSTSSRKSTPKRILRQPVSYTYVRGLSGLPTIRVPRQGSAPSTGCGR